MIPEDKLAQISQHFAFLEAKLNTGLAGAELVKLSREYSELGVVIEKVNKYRHLQSDIHATEAMLSDPELAELADEELEQLRRALPLAERDLQLAFLPKDKDDAKPAIIEIRAGTGGDEAALFAADLLRMYTRYAEARGWKFEMIDESPTELGGYREAIGLMSGKDVFSFMKFESGVHRVQRVPDTEASGRIHTSAATVAVLPEAEEVEIDIPATDIRIDTMRASGAGGQHVNTTDSAVRITHLPTGIVVTSAKKSQHQNRARAMDVLRTRLYDLERQKIDGARAAQRKGQVGSGDRSERIRTYNFPQGRVTDHRIGLTLYKLDSVMQGDLDEIIARLRAAHEAERLSEFSL